MLKVSRIIAQQPRLIRSISIDTGVAEKAVHLFYLSTDRGKLSYENPVMQEE